MSPRHVLPVSCLALVLVGCASAPPPPIAVMGTPSSVAGLAGRWVGDYRLSDGSRHGVVSFDLKSGDNFATGSVIMQPASLTTVSSLAPRGDIPHPQGSELTVRFVAVESGMVRGELEPYVEPECACRVVTVFQGRRSGDHIEGTFIIRNTVTGETKAGDWRVRLDQ